MALQGHFLQEFRALTASWSEFCQNPAEPARLGESISVQTVFGSPRLQWNRLRARGMTTERASNDGTAKDERPSALLALLNIRGLLAIALIYLLSIIPAYVALLLLRSRGIDLFAPYESFYWP